LNEDPRHMIKRGNRHVSDRLFKVIDFKGGRAIFRQVRDLPRIGGQRPMQTSPQRRYLARRSNFKRKTGSAVSGRHWCSLEFKL
jgi:hypothetical protein